MGKVTYPRPTRVMRQNSGNLQVTITPALHRAVRVVAVERAVTQSALVARWIAEGVARDGEG